MPVIASGITSGLHVCGVVSLARTGEEITEPVA
jgi:hypothetical protein